MGDLRETDLYAPIKQFLEQQEFAVKGEIHDCDLVALRGDETVIVELKKTFNLELVLQGIDRQRISDAVYLAVPAPGNRSRNSRWQDIQHLCRRLGLGLLTVAFGTRTPRVEICCQPEEVAPKRNKARRTALLTEFKARATDRNTGGTTRRALVTAYRESALRIARHLADHGPTKLKDVRTATGVLNAGQILRDNYYRWFDRIATGIYQLSPTGAAAIETYRDVVNELI